MVRIKNQADHQTEIFVGLLIYWFRSEGAMYIKLSIDIEVAMLIAHQSCVLQGGKREPAKHPSKQIESLLL